MLRSLQKPEWVTSLKDVVEKSSSYREVISALGLSKSGSKYKSVQKWIQLLEISTSHFTSPGFKKGHIVNRISDDAVLVENSPYDQSVLRRVAKGIIPEICSECGVSDEYNGKPLTLQLDHINGIRNDNRKENLRWVCPNCHSQTPTWGSKRRPVNLHPCIVCGDPCKKKYCSSKCCGVDHRAKGIIGVHKIAWPDNKTLTKMITTAGYEATARVLGVSGNAVRKHLKTTPT